MIVAISIYVVASIFAVILVSSDEDFDHPILNGIIFILILPFTLTVTILVCIFALIAGLITYITR